jgi:hypothetical protein
MTNRTQAWQARQMAHIPDGLFDRLLKAHVYGTKQLAQIGLVLSRGDGNQPAEVERCPHCGGTVRVRWLVGARAQKIIQQWIDGGMPGNTFGDESVRHPESDEASFRNDVLTETDADGVTP